MGCSALFSVADDEPGKADSSLGSMDSFQVGPVFSLMRCLKHKGPTGPVHMRHNVVAP